MKINILFPVALAMLLLASCQEKPAPADAPAAEQLAEFTIVPGERVGLITPSNCTPGGVLAAYQGLAVADSVHLSEGMFEEGVVLYPDDERRMATIYWDREWSTKYPAFIRIMGDSTGATEWKTANGITIGTTLAEVEKLNGKPFELFGFNWDYGGYVTNWNGGNLEGKMNLRFDAPNASFDRLQGEVTLLSNDPAVRSAGTTVWVMEFRFRAQEQVPACILEKAQAFEGPGKMNVRKMTVDGKDHFWLNDGASAYDGIEHVFDADCQEVCQMGGFRQELPACQKVYENGKWELLWESW